MCRDKTASVHVTTSASLALIRIGGGNKILTYWSESIAVRLEALAQFSVADPSSNVSRDFNSRVIANITFYK